MKDEKSEAVIVIKYQNSQTVGRAPDVRFVSKSSSELFLNIREGVR